MSKLIMDGRGIYEDDWHFPPIHSTAPFTFPPCFASTKSLSMTIMVDFGEQETHLTVLKTSIFFAGDGFTAHDSHGRLVFRVDSYGGPDTREHRELVLMDALGRSLITLRRKRPSLHQRWEGFAGEGEDGSKPIFSVRRSSMIGRSDVAVEVYDPPGVEYQIEGSFAKRSCTVYDANERSAVADIRRKVDATANVVLGKDTFLLAVKSGFDCAFAMALVLVLDQISGDDDGVFDHASSEESGENHQDRF